MNDLISRQAALDALNHELRCGAVINQCGLEVAYEVIEGLPSEEPQRIRAKWIATTALQEGQITWRDYKCSNCSHHRKKKPMNFCEVCGAKMER